MDCARVPGLTGQRCAPLRMVPPRSELASRFSTLPSRSIHSVMSATTGCGADGSNSVLLAPPRPATWRANRSEEHTSELQSLMRISYAVFCLKKKKHNKTTTTIQNDIRTKQQYT